MTHRSRNLSRNMPRGNMPRDIPKRLVTLKGLHPTFKSEHAKSIAHRIEAQSSLKDPLSYREGIDFISRFELPRSDVIKLQRLALIHLR